MGLDVDVARAKFCLMNLFIDRCPLRVLRTLNPWKKYKVEPHGLPLKQKRADMCYAAAYWVGKL